MKQRKNKEPIPKDENKAVAGRGEKKKVDIKSLVLLIVNTIIIFVVYQIFIDLPVFMYFLTVFLSVFTALVLAYVIYNRGFTRKNLTPDMLPESWTEDVKTEYIEDGKRRLNKSKWMLTLIIPFVITFGIDVITLFLVPYFENLFK